VIRMIARKHSGSDPYYTGMTTYPVSKRSLFSVENQNNAPALWVKADGRLGLGTKSPAEQLHVTRNAEIDGDFKVDGSTTMKKAIVTEGLQVTGDITIEPQGDISMGHFGG